MVNKSNHESGAYIHYRFTRYLYLIAISSDLPITSYSYLFWSVWSFSLHPNSLRHFHIILLACRSYFRFALCFGMRTFLEKDHWIVGPLIVGAEHCQESSRSSPQWSFCSTIIGPHGRCLRGTPFRPRCCNGPIFHKVLKLVFVVFSSSLWCRKVIGRPGTSSQTRILLGNCHESRGSWQIPQSGPTRFSPHSNKTAY